ncbi:MAG: zinc-binding dehydrogenase [Armatimonadota bacterium]
MERQIAAIVFEEAGRVGVRELILPSCGPREIIAETIYSFVSPGTELRVLGGVKESRGRFPLIPGYAWVGRIIEVGAELTGWQVGELVTGRNPLPIPGMTQLWGGQASHHRCEVSGYDAVLKLPAGADPWDYITVEVSAISWRGVTAAFPAPGETAVVIGQGMIGAFSAKWLLYHGARVIVTDLWDSRLARGKQWGAAAFNANDPAIREQILALCDGGADIVVEASSSPEGVALASSILRQPVYRSLHAAYPAAALRGNAAVWPRLVLQATYTHTTDTAPGGDAGAEGTLILKPGDRTVGDRLAAMERVRAGDLPVADIVDRPTPVADAPRAYAALRDTPGEISAVAFAWQ